MIIIPINHILTINIETLRSENKSIFLIFSMETFLPYKLNRAERAQDASKAKSLGPFAMLLRECSVFDKTKSKYTDKLTP